MTTNPEQTVPPLSDNELAEIRERAEWQSRIAIEGSQAREDGALLVRLCDIVAEARRQRDERPAGRVVWRGRTSRWQRNVRSVVAAPPVDVPPGTEVAVVVLADDGAQSGEGEQ